MDQCYPASTAGAEAILNLKPTSSIPIAYHPLFGSHDDLILLELDDKLLPDVLHQRVSLRGDPDEDAVLCTCSKTYAIKFVGTSNSPLLIPPSAHLDAHHHDHAVLAPVIKVSPGNLEIVEVAPRLDKLKLLLSENPYSPREVIEMVDLDDFHKNKKGLYKWDDLTDMIQASDNELRTGLQALSALEIDGYWRTVDETYMDTILRMLLLNSVLKDWLLDALNEEQVVTVMESDGFPQKLVHHCLHIYGSKVDGGEDTKSCVWKLDERQVCVHFAREILRSGKRKMENFMEEWLQKIPDRMQASFDMLEGEVLTEKIGVETWIHD